MAGRAVILLAAAVIIGAAMLHAMDRGVDFSALKAQTGTADTTTPKAKKAPRTAVTATTTTSTTTTTQAGCQCHNVCTAGAAECATGCSDPCVATVCAEDPTCCDPSSGWTLLCVSEVDTFCCPSGGTCCLP